MYNYNPYNYGMGSYYQQPYNSMQPQQNNYQNQNQTTPQQTNYIPLAFINNLDEVNKFIVSPNASVYLRDNNSNKLFIKSCDSTGKYNLKTYELVEMDANGQNKANEQQNINSKEFIGKEDLQALEDKISAKFEELQKKLTELKPTSKLKEN